MLMELIIEVEHVKILNAYFFFVVAHIHVKGVKLLEMYRLVRAS